MRVALVHDWITGMRGGERCLERFLSFYPEADIYTLLHIPGKTTKEIDARVKGTSFLQKIPGIENHYRKLLPLFPSAARSLKIEGYDLVISLSHAAAKNVKLVNVKKHVCYCFTPMRYIWDMAPVYFQSGLKFAWPLISSLRSWDKSGANQVDEFVTISRFVSSRVRRFYKRDSTVLYPPVDTSWFSADSGTRESQEREAFLYAGAFVPYKGVELIIDVFNELNLPLWCIGKGPLESNLRKRAGGNIEFLGQVSDSELKRYYQKARALIFPAKEDFGIIPIEAMASGTPIIAGYHGALRETLPGYRWWLGEKLDREKHCGVFFNPRGDEKEELKKTIEVFLNDEDLFQPKIALNNAQRFSVDQFSKGWNEFIC